MSFRGDHSFDPLRPYDDSMWDHFEFYDNMPYTWSSDIDKKILTLISGNVIKSNRCVMKNEPFVIKH